MLFEPFVRFHILVKFGQLSGRLFLNLLTRLTKKYLNVDLVLPTPFWRGNVFLIVSFPDHFLLVPFYPEI